MFSFGGQEFLIIAVVALLLFGPDKIPQLARTIGRFTREFNKYKSIMEQTLSAEIYRAEGPAKDEMTIEERIAKAGAASAAITESREATDAEGGDEVSDATSPSDGEITETSEPEVKAAPRPKVVAARSADETDEEDEG